MWNICLLNDAIHGFSAWLRTGSNPADINWFEALLEINLHFRLEDESIHMGIKLIRDKGEVKKFSLDFVKSMINV